MRVNDFQPDTIVLKYKSDKARKEVRGNGYSKRKRAEGEALPPDETLHWKRRPVYKTGDGDISYHQRTGSDHSHIKSFGNLT